MKLPNISGEWQTTKTYDEDSDTSRIEFCVRLDSLPGSVKCVITEYEGTNIDDLDYHPERYVRNNTVENFVVLYVGGRYKEVLDISESTDSFGVVGYDLFGGTSDIFSPAVKMLFRIPDFRSRSQSTLFERLRPSSHV